MVVVLLIVGLLGVVVAVLGVGDVAKFGVALGEFEVSTTSIGLALATIGFGAAVFLVTRLPNHVQIFGESPIGVADRLRSAGPIVALAAVIAAALLVASLVVTS